MKKIVFTVIAAVALALAVSGQASADSRHQGPSYGSAKSRQYNQTSSSVTRQNQNAHRNTAARGAHKPPRQEINRCQAYTPHCNPKLKEGRHPR